MKGSFMLRPIAAAICAAALLPLTAAATDGYFSHGYGMRAKGMGGASYGLALDSMGGANNPASMAFVGTRLDVGHRLVQPTAQRRAAARARAQRVRRQRQRRTSSSRSSATTTCSGPISRWASRCTATAA